MPGTSTPAGHDQSLADVPEFPDDFPDDASTIMPPGPRAGPRKRKPKQSAQERWYVSFRGSA